jgi:hypothetical protein
MPPKRDIVDDKITPLGKRDILWFWRGSCLLYEGEPMKPTKVDWFDFCEVEIGGLVVYY